MLTAKKTDAVAAEWAARIDRGPLSPEEERALSQWLALDSRHLGAFMRARAISRYTERARALGPNFDPDRFVPRPVPSQKYGSVRRWCLAAAAVCATIVLAMRLIGGTVAYDTRRGEMRVVALADGSVMTLNTTSHAKVDFTHASRQVHLEGEALFHVAKDAAHPFIVVTGHTSVRAIGTSFLVRHLTGQPVEVIVREGVVEVWQPTMPSPVRVAANMRTELREGETGLVQAIPLQPAAMDREFAWLDGQIAFEAVTLRGAVAAFDRYSATHIIIDDPVVAEKEITGLFASRDPAAFARAAAVTLRLRAETRNGEIHLGSLR